MIIQRGTRALSFAVPLIFLAGTATAGGLSDPIIPVAPPPPPVPMADWTGPYVGLQVGNADVETDDTDDLVETDGAIYGLHAGYLFDLGAIVLGAEIDYDLTNIDEESVDPDADLEIDHIARAKVRLGYDAGSFLPYVTGGIARLELTSFGIERTDTGTFFGGGLEYRVGSNIRVGAELLHHQFEEFDDTITDIDATTIALRASYQF
ncbi:porin family protein [Cognatiyoonia sp. IB215182]|uniref:outer membrane protein n=1 Tax=Cognatiyoonia sp. IB215182 TaxID=3097353 RepID=UPI002A103BE4|nr:porin family protein [Cognatiyoonia sp. IB215182]MDX8350774.1 porin family protein [Cognatiyoonia sp. IB215182]